MNDIYMKDNNNNNINTYKIVHDKPLSAVENLQEVNKKEKLQKCYI